MFSTGTNRCAVLCSLRLYNKTAPQSGPGTTALANDASTFALIYMAVGMWIYLHLGGVNLHPLIGMALWFVLMFSSVIVCNEGFMRRLKGANRRTIHR